MLQATEKESLRTPKASVPPGKLSLRQLLHMETVPQDGRAMLGDAYPLPRRPGCTFLASAP
ncbi:hypothetical protein SPHV1_410028 [Novosphingobium sp. KN65.2]|nr:hypothetical protein SPHV1_410028 [Novosphingobium sp. KN65.2]